MTDSDASHPGAIERLQTWAAWKLMPGQKKYVLMDLRDIERDRRELAIHSDRDGPNYAAERIISNLMNIEIHLGLESLYPTEYDTPHRERAEREDTE